MSMPSVLYADRADAGRRLAEALAGRDLKNPIIYALPRGGVPLAVEVGRRLKAPVDLVLVRKLGAPGSPELAAGAVADGGQGLMVLNPDVVRSTGASEAYLDRARREALEEIERRREVYLGDRPRPDPKGRTVIIVDDGLATGATAKAAAASLRAQGAERIILAVPVGPADTVETMAGDCDEVICLEQPTPFWGVGGFYSDFRQVSDAEVVDLLTAG